MESESKPNEEQDWKARLFEKFDNIERRFDNIELRINDLEARIEQNTEWVKLKVSQSMQSAGAALDEHVLYAEGKHHES